MTTPILGTASYRENGWILSSQRWHLWLCFSLSLVTFLIICLSFLLSSPDLSSSPSASEILLLPKVCYPVPSPRSLLSHLSRPTLTMPFSKLQWLWSSAQLWIKLSWTVSFRGWALPYVLECSSLPQLGFYSPLSSHMESVSDDCMHADEGSSCMCGTVSPAASSHVGNDSGLKFLRVESTGTKDLTCSKLRR